MDLGQRFTAYLAPPDRVEEVVREIAPQAGSGEIAVRGRLVFAPGPPVESVWSRNIWRNPVPIPVGSIGEAASALRAMQRNWVLYSTACHRRAALIDGKLPPIRSKPLVFPAPAPAAPLGSWTLIDRDTLVAASDCSSPFPHGEARFAEDKQAPPNRAYLKLFELFTRTGQAPGPGQRCLDLGASPGGWSWVLSGLGAEVVCVDKAPLAPKVARLPRVSFIEKSAFSLDPRDLGPFDWLFCDVVCYPERLFRLIGRWLESGQVRSAVATIKFQGTTDLAVQARFAAIPGSRLFHLFHNKHELTWTRLLAPSPVPAAHTRRASTAGSL